MKKRFYLITILLIVLGLASLIAVRSQAQEIYSYVPVYSILGTVNDTPEASANGNLVVFFSSLADYDKGIYAYDTVGKTGSAALDNRYLISAASNLLLPLTVGQAYKVAVVRDSNGYGAGPVDVTISGSGYDIAPDMAMAYGAGVGAPGAVAAQAPVIKQVWFGNRLYQKRLVEEGEQFIVDRDPLIKAKIEATGTWGIDPRNIVMMVNWGTPQAKSYTMTAADIKETIYAAGDTTLIQSLAVEYSLPEGEPLPLEQDSTVTIRASDASGQAATDEVCTVTVLGGPLRIVGPVVVYPSPFSIRKDGTCTIQYTLSNNSNIEIYIFAVGGQLVKKMAFFSGSEGGSTGINKVTWDGRTQAGLLAGNAVYVGTVVAKDEGRMLARFKFTILD